MPPSNTRQLDSICRVYKNAAGDVIAIEEAAINVNSFKLSNNTGKYHRSVESVPVFIRRLNQGVGQDRTIASVIQIGHYDSVSTNSGNYNELTYLAASDDINTIKISLSPYVKQIGDTV